MKRIFNSKRDHVLARVCVFLIVAALIAGMVGCVPVSQNLEIQDWYDLDAVRNNLDGSYILMNDLDYTAAGYEELASPTANGGKGWQPIGAGPSFTGSFDGQGHEIRNLFIDRSDEAIHVGLFRWVGREGIIKDIGAVNVTMIGISGAGGLVGYSQGTVSNSYSTGNVIGGSEVGGLVGVNAGTVSNSYFNGSVTGNSSVGGLVGLNDEGNISNSHYNYEEVLINGENIITIGALFSDDFEEWLANGKFLDINEMFSHESGYYVISDVDDFKHLLAFCQDSSLKFRLINDLEFTTEPNLHIPYLAGEFHGNGHRISNLSFNFDFVSNVGLFGYLAPGGAVTGVGVENENITGYNYVGGLVGWNIEGTISNSYATGSVYGGGFVGGLVGMNSEGTVSDSYSVGNVSGGGFVGGLVGINYKGTVSASHSTGNTTGYVWVGGLVGINDGTVRKSYSSGSVTGDYNVGGLVGEHGEGTISCSYSTSIVTGTGSFVGGLVGTSGGYSSTVSNSYSTGSVTGNSSVGGLVGENEGGTVSNCFWDIETSGQTTSDGGTGKNTTEMQYIATFSGAGWNIAAVANPSLRNLSYIWNIVNNVTYPFLSWQPVS